MAESNIVADRQFGSHQFREIYKNAWLKKVNASNTRKSGSAQKTDRFWIVFCIHDDNAAFLEAYIDMKISVVHKPCWFVSLNDTLHVSPTICPDDQEYEFVVTLKSSVVRLLAPSWNAMSDWVETLRLKLTEMHILSPCENMYSALPETKGIGTLLPTRDPTSPLPAPPQVPAAFVPGIERIPSTITEHSNSNNDHIRNDEMNNTDESNIVEIQTDLNITITPIANDCDNMESNTDIAQTELQSINRRHVLSRNLSVPNTAAITTSQNVTIIQVLDNGPRSASSLPSRIFEFNFTQPESPNIISCAQLSTVTDFESHSAVGVTTETENQIVDTEQLNNSQQEIPNCPSSNSTILCRQCDKNSCVCQHYDRVYIPDLITAASQQGPKLPADLTKTRTNRNEGATTSFSNLAAESSSPDDVRIQSRLQATVSERHKCSRTKENVPQSSSSPSNFVQQRHRSSSVSEVSSNGNMNRNFQSRMAINTATNVNAIDRIGRETARLTLREQQVMRLRKEILHSSGVRLQLCRKDCNNAIALVDVFGAVWVSGWKQREHPMLYNLLHIGDQLVSVAGVTVHSASEAHKHLRAAACNHYIEVIVRRLPFGRVFALQRDVEGQSLGIVQENNTAVVKEVSPNGLAAKHGLPQRAVTCDGFSFTNWVLTEINGRPLNLFFKNNEVRDRLNAIGREISILVQPLDLIKQLKKQLKSIRNYKEYIVQ